MARLELFLTAWRCSKKQWVLHHCQPEPSNVLSRWDVLQQPLCFPAFVVFWLLIWTGIKSPVGPRWPLGWVSVHLAFTAGAGAKQLSFKPGFRFWLFDQITPLCAPEQFYVLTAWKQWAATRCAVFEIDVCGSLVMDKWPEQFLWQKGPVSCESLWADEEPFPLVLVSRQLLKCPEVRIWADW